MMSSFSWDLKKFEKCSPVLSNELMHEVGVKHINWHRFSELNMENLSFRTVSLKEHIILGDISVYLLFVRLSYEVSIS